MTGRLLFAEPHDRALFTVGADRRLRYRDQRKLQGLWPAGDDSDVVRLLEGQGPDALEMDREEFEAALSARRGSIKTVLTNQSVVAELGNLLADEILWRAKVRPSTHSNDLTEADRRRLYTQMRRTLHSAIPTGRVPLRHSWLTGHRDTPSPLPPLRRAATPPLPPGGRTTVWCVKCQ